MRGIALEVEDALGGQAQELPNLIVAGLPQMTVVAGILHQHFMRAHRIHAIVDAVAAAAGLAFDVIERRGMHHRARRPDPRALGSCGDDLRGVGGVGAKTAGDFGTRPLSAGSSPVMTQERVMGSLRSSMR